ncbi:unnamed protein product [Absidia cylindrospora]
MCPIDTGISTPSPTLLSSTSSSRHTSPLTPGSCLANTVTTAATDSTTSFTSNSNSLSLTTSLSNQSLVRRTLLLPKSPTSPTFWKRQHYFQYSKPTSPTDSTMDDSSNSTNSTSNLRVLLVDDNDINLKVLEKALKLHMADIFEYMDMVSSGECAIEKLRQQAYDLILMDIDMPGLNGVDAASWIRRGHQLQEQRFENYSLDTVLIQNRRAPIVAVTTNMSLEWKKTYLKVGMNGCLAKPISPIILRHSLTQVLMYGSYWDYSTS